MNAAPLPDETLPGLLPGARVTFRNGAAGVGTILRTGHRYGPGGWDDQAQVEFPCHHAADPGNPHPCRRKARVETTAGWYDLHDLSFA